MVSVKLQSDICTNKFVNGKLIFFSPILKNVQSVHKYFQNSSNSNGTQGANAATKTCEVKPKQGKEESKANNSLRGNSFHVPESTQGSEVADFL